MHPVRHRGGLSQPGTDFLVVFFALLFNHEAYLFSLFFPPLRLGNGELVPLI